LRMALQRAGQHGVEAPATRTPVLAQAQALCAAQRTKLIVVISAQ